MKDVVLILNAGSDAGRQIADDLLSAGCKVVITGRRATALIPAVHCHREGQVLAIAADTTDRAQVYASMRSTTLGPNIFHANCLHTFTTEQEFTHASTPHSSAASQLSAQSRGTAKHRCIGFHNSPITSAQRTPTRDGDACQVITGQNSELGVNQQSDGDDRTTHRADGKQISVLVSSRQSGVPLDLVLFGDVTVVTTFEALGISSRAIGAQMEQTFVPAQADRSAQLSITPKVIRASPR